MVKQKLYLFSWIDFGKYRSKPRRLEKIIDTPDGRRWLHWLIDNSYLFEFDKSVLEKLKEKESDEGRVLQQARS